MLMKKAEIEQIRGHFIWSQEEKNRLLSHIEDLQALVDPKAFGLKYIEQQMALLAEMQKDLAAQKEAVKIDLESEILRLQSELTKLALAK